MRWETAISKDKDDKEEEVENVKMRDEGHQEEEEKFEDEKAR